MARGRTNTILWRRLDGPGHEFARLRDGGDDGRRVLDGVAIFVEPDEQMPCRLEYEVVCDAGWRTIAASAHGLVGDRPVHAELTVDARGRWRLNGVEVPAVDGCADVDLAFTPATNSLPIRRLGLAVGQRADARAAWLRYPEFDLAPLDQVYHRVDATTYEYESSGGHFRANLRVDCEGWVTSYENTWAIESSLGFQND
jgi:hypothetical protein